MKEVIERCNWLVNDCNDKAITPDVKDDFRYLLEEIERLNNDYLEMKDNFRTANDEIERLNNIINELEEYVEDRISVLTIGVDNKTKDEYFNNKCIGGVQELKNVKSILSKEVIKSDRSS